MIMKQMLFQLLEYYLSTREHALQMLQLQPIENFKSIIKEIFLFLSY